jgi:hypothetical protein
MDASREDIVADIVVVKKGSKAWVWMLLVALVLVGLWLMMGRSDQQVGYRFDGGQPRSAALSSLTAAEAV